MLQGRDSVTQRQRETTAILISLLSNFKTRMTTFKKMGPKIHLGLRLKFTLCVGWVGSTFGHMKFTPRGLRFNSRQVLTIFFLVSEGFEPTCTEFRSALIQNITIRPKAQRNLLTTNWPKTIKIGPCSWGQNNTTLKHSNHTEIERNINRRSRT